MYGDASGNIGDLSGNFSDAGGGGGPSTADYNSSFDFSNYSDEASGLSAGAYSKDVAQAIADMLGTPLGEGAATGRGFHSPGLSYGTLAGLQGAGFGKTDIPGFTQNVEQALAARNVADFMEKAVPALVGLIPNYGIVSTIGRVGAGLMSNTMTPAQALTAGIAGALGAKTGIPAPVFEGILSGDFGKAAGAGVQGGLTSLANNLTGSPLGGLALNLSGIGPAVNKGVAEAVSGGTGGSRSSGLGAALGLPSAPSQGSSPTGNTYGDAGINADTYSVLAAIEQAAQEPKQPEWSSQMTAGRYGPLMDYQFGA
jgi:hypothetical protein